MADKPKKREIPEWLKRFVPAQRTLKEIEERKRKSKEARDQKG